MNIEVGSRWKKTKGESYIVKILYIAETAVFYKNIEENAECIMELQHFKNQFTPYFKWQKVKLIDLGDGDRITYHQYWGDNDFELLHNYKRYFETCMKGFSYINSYTLNRLGVPVKYEEFQLGTLYFGTKENAEEFAELAIENGWF